MLDLLDRIKLPEDLKNLSDREVKQLAKEIRAFLVKSVAQTGGHLASNLGVVELTLALYKVFDFPKDKIIWDVGHQSYVHKILSGRKDKFPTLRKFDGMSGFPKTCESEYDCFNTGHSSTSASAALGFARARDLAGGKENVIAVFGDGALTGGMLYEALNDAGHSKTRLILILNDNAMSISRNVGAISKHLRKLRTKPGYYKSKRRVEKFLAKLPLCGKIFASLIRKIKFMLRSMVLPPTMFDDLGFEYIGPVDGHDIEAVSDALKAAKQSSKPVLLHVLTKKGKGYAPAEKNPQYFHGVSRFENEAEILEKGGKKDYSAVFGKVLCDIAQKNKDVAAITAAMPIGTGLDLFCEKFKTRFFDVGIAEQHAVTFAAGMAMSGKIPVVAVYSSFLQRAYDQILHDVCLQNLHVVFCIDRAGVVGADGETHHGLYDVAFLSHMPNMAVLSPSSFDELEKMLYYAVNIHKGPIAIRYPRGNDEFSKAVDFEFAKANVISQGEDITVISTGRMMKKAHNVCEKLKLHGVNAELMEMGTIVPFDAESFLQSVKKTGVAAVIEDHAEGGLCAMVSDCIAKNNVPIKLKCFAFPKQPVTHGSVEELDCLYKLDEESIVNEIILELKD